MKKTILFLLLTILLIPLELVLADADDDDDVLLVTRTDAIDQNPWKSAYYDLRSRKSYLQITNPENENVRIHIQIFQHDRECSELDFFDELTPNDTVIYDLDNLVRNNGSEVPANLNDDSYGFIAISPDDGSGGILGDVDLIGNFRIVDDSGYEYRTNIAGSSNSETGFDDAIAEFNTVSDAKYADVVGYAYILINDCTVSSVANLDAGFNFEIFQFDLDEEPLSCDIRNFACGNVMNYGINEDYLNSRGGPLLCPGGGLANPDGSFVSFENGRKAEDPNEDVVFVGLIGINNNNGTGSMDYWVYHQNDDT